MSANQQFVCRHFSDLGLEEFYRIIMAREAVFVVEQTCPYQETDELDAHAWHLQLFDNQVLAAYARIIPPGVKSPYSAIGRVLTVREFRGQNLARKLMHEAIKQCIERFGNTPIKIGAQVYLQSFYASLGFVACSEQYDEDGIAHIDMIKQ